MGKGSSNIQDSVTEIGEKAETIERLSEVLAIEGSKVVIVMGVPNDSGGLDLEIQQYGHQYRHELYGFMREGIEIVDNSEGDDE